MKGALPIFLAIYCCWYLALLPANERALKVASLYVGHKEEAPNRSPVIDYWNERIGVPHGSNYCASFVAFVLDSAKVNQPTVRSAVAQHYITKQSVSATRVVSGKTIPKGSLVIWKRGTSWMGHVEFVREDWSGCRGLTIGANTTSGQAGDQRQGNGVYKRQRHIDQTAFFRITDFTLLY